MQQQPAWGEGCTYRFNSLHTKHGRIFSPRFPQNYPPDTNCRYTFRGAPDECVSLAFSSINLFPANMYASSAFS